MKRLKNKQGLTMMELLMSMLILVSIFVGTMYSFIKCIELNESSKNSSLALLSIKNKISQIEDTSYAQIYSTFNNVTFTDAGVGKERIGVTTVDDSVSNELSVKVIFCWREQNQRIFGEDKNFNGVLDTGEDVNGNGELDSVVQITTVINKS